MGHHDRLKIGRCSLNGGEGCFRTVSTPQPAPCEQTISYSERKRLRASEYKDAE